MGLLQSVGLGAAKTVVMPFGEPPCADDPHHHAHTAPPPPTPQVPGLEAKIKMANDYVEQEFQAALKVRYKLKDLYNKVTDEWNQYKKPVEDACMGVHKALECVAHDSQQCEDAQNTSLPNVFERRKELVPEKRGPIHGCAMYKNVSAIEYAPDCKCAAGSEGDGCRDAKNTSDHTLACTHLRKRVLPAMALWRMTSPGGECFLDKKSTVNQPMLPSGDPEDFKLMDSTQQSSMSPFLLLPPVPLMPDSSQDDVRSKLSQVARAFL
mmetsp:Transcript_55848/g.88503  ORF Transcript_55848/g.88503 Transcript_55848/m.88503 type:complete len:266 (-) Transcript_55848:107-904(-)